MQERKKVRKNLLRMISDYFLTGQTLSASKDYGKKNAESCRNCIPPNKDPFIHRYIRRTVDRQCERINVNMESYPFLPLFKILTKKTQQN